MKKVLLACLVILTILTTLLTACSGGGTPTPPVSKLVDLDTLVTNNMTVDQVSALMTTALKQSGKIYPATRVELSAKGNWIVYYKAADVKAGESAPYQVFWFPPTKATPNNFFAIFFKGNAVTGKSWFDLQGGAVAEQNLGIE